MYCSICGLTTIKKKYKEIFKDWKFRLSSLDEELWDFCERCNKSSGGDIKWLEKRPSFEEHFNQKKHIPTYLANYSLCNTCKFINWHPLIYCYGCGNKMCQVKMNYTELKENYPDYKVGC